MNVPEISTHDRIDCHSETEMSLAVDDLGFNVQQLTCRSPNFLPSKIGIPGFSKVPAKNIWYRS